MKRTIYCSIVLLCLVSAQSHAQAFEKKNILLSFGLGGINDFSGSSSGGDGLFIPPSHLHFYPLRPQFMVKAEFAPHKYWGVGFIASVDGRANMTYDFGQGYYSKESTLNAQLALLVNYHFYQLIADKLGRPAKMHADKLDIYTGFTAGATINFAKVNGVSSGPFFSPIMGLHLGVRYYVTPRISVFGEIGVGQSWFNTGVTFKLPGQKKAKPMKTF